MTLNQHDDQYKPYIVQSPNFSYQLCSGTAVAVKGFDEDGFDYKGIYLIKENQGDKLILLKADGKTVNLPVHVYEGDEFQVEIKILGGVYADDSLPF